MSVSKLGTNVTPIGRVEDWRLAILDRVCADTELRGQFAAVMAAVEAASEPPVLCMYKPAEAMVIFALTGDKTRFALKQWSTHLHKLLKGRITYVGARELLVHALGFECYLVAKEQEVDYRYANAHGPSCLNARFTLSVLSQGWFVRKDVRL